MKTKAKFSTLILFLGVIFNFQDVYPFEVSAPPNFYVPFECADYSGFVDVDFTDMLTAYWQFTVTQGEGDLTIQTPYCYPQYSFAEEPSVGWVNIEDYGTVKISIGISRNDRIPNQYRYIKFKYRYTYRLDQPWSKWYEKNIKIEVENFGISGDSYVCTSNKTYSISPSMPEGYSGSWSFSPSNMVTPNSGTGSSATFRGISCLVPGEGTLYYTLTRNDCPTFDLEKDIVVIGPEAELDVYYSSGGKAPYSYGYFFLCPYTTYHLYAVNNTSCLTSDYEWTYPEEWTFYYQYQNMISIHTNNQPGGQVIITAETCCTDCDDVEILVGYLGEYWDCGDGYYMASPNPADRYIDIDVDQEKMTAEDSSPGSECVLKMVDKTGMVKYTDEFREFPYRINTSNLPEGPYIINLIREGKMFSIQVIIEH